MSNDEMNERTQLLANEGDTIVSGATEAARTTAGALSSQNNPGERLFSPNITYGAMSDVNQTSTTVAFQTGPSEQPEPFQSAAENGVVHVSCRICLALIDITSKQDQHVVKCNQCGEATPIRDAPPGKKYVRCPCNCLLICRTVSLKIACPRTNCKRIINLQPSPITPPIPFSPGLCKVSCAHCHDSFLFNTLNNNMARCPHCQKVSSVGQQFSRSRFVMFLTLMIIYTLAIAALIVSTFKIALVHKTFFFGYFLLSLLIFYFLNRSIYYYRVKVSIIDETMQ